MTNSDKLNGTQVQSFIGAVGKSNKGKTLGVALMDVLHDKHKGLYDDISQTGNDPRTGKIKDFFIAICNEDGLKCVPKAFQQ